MSKLFTITKWCKSITDDGKDLYTHRKLDTDNVIKFRLLDDDGIIYAYGIMDKDRFENDENVEGFEPLDKYMYAYGCTEIQYKNEKVENMKHYKTRLHGKFVDCTTQHNKIVLWMEFTNSRQNK